MQSVAKSFRISPRGGEEVNYRSYEPASQATNNKFHLSHYYYYYYYKILKLEYLRIKHYPSPRLSVKEFSNDSTLSSSANISTS